MPRRYNAATALLVLGIGGCSSEPPKLNLPDGALPGGTAEVTVDGNSTGLSHDVRCANIAKGLTEIKIGGAGGEVRALLVADIPKGIAFKDVKGFTGSYWQNLQGTARLDIDDQTLTLSGAAAGFSTESPFVRTTNGFIVKVAC